MQALGLVETKGLIGAIESADIMLKTAEVSLWSKELVGGGLVTVTIVGDVAAVKTAVEAAASAVENLGCDLLYATHVIPRPAENIGSLLTTSTYEQPVSEQDILEVETFDKETQTEAVEVLATSDHQPTSLVEQTSILVPEDTGFMATESLLATTEANLQHWLEMGDREQSNAALSEMKVIDLRKLAKKQVDFPISKKDIYRTNKEKLIEALIDYFNKN